MDKKFMQLAIKKAKRGKTPFGAVIVDSNNNIVAKAYNTVIKKQNSIKHAEINVIEKACKKLKTWNLSGCEIYSTCLPCPMCASAIHWARIKKIYFGIHIKDAKEFGFNEIDSEATNIILSNCQVEGGILREECYQLLLNYKGEKY